jgi:hypothetical protein
MAKECAAIADAQWDECNGLRLAWREMTDQYRPFWDRLWQFVADELVGFAHHLELMESGTWLKVPTDAVPPWLEEVHRVLAQRVIDLSRGRSTGVADEPRVLRARSGDTSRQKPRMSKDEANGIARHLLTQDRSFAEKSAREWSSEIGCSLGLVSKLPLWKAVQERKPARGKGARPMAVAHIEGVHSLEGDAPPADVLNGLILDQEEEMAAEARRGPRQFRAV